MVTVMVFPFPPVCPSRASPRSVSSAPMGNFGGGCMRTTARKSWTDRGAAARRSSHRDVLNVCYHMAKQPGDRSENSTAEPGEFRSLPVAAPGTSVEYAP